ncbi:MAG TPA: tetratricopeptide repeat protein [Xanthobacteraceae bacterium]
MTVSRREDIAFQRALAAFRAGNAEEAARLFKLVLRKQPGHVGALNLLGIVLTQLRKFAEAEAYLRLALQQRANSDATLYNYGLVLKALNRPAEALERFTQALAMNSNVAEAWNNRGTIFNDLKRYDEAVGDFDSAIRLNPRYAEAFCNRGKSLAILERFDQALAAFDRALELKPGLAEAWCGRGNLSARHKRYDEASAAYDKALALKPDFAEAWLGRGDTLAALKRCDHALAAYERALALKPELAEAWSGRGNVLAELRNYDQAFAAYERALALKSDLAEAWLGRGNVSLQLKRYDDAFTAYDKAVLLKPHLDYAASARLLAKLHLCDWTDLAKDVASVLSIVRDRKALGAPSAMLPIPSSASDQLLCAKRHFQHQPSFPPIWHGEVCSHDRIRIAYLSADFHDHATARLAVGLFEQHDKSRFEVTGLSFGPDQESTLRQRIKSAFEHFADVRFRSDRDVADLIRQLNIDIAVDLKGFTADNRLDVLARRAAPIQVNYLGYPGTMGADYIDYILADSTVIPEDQRAHYSEQVVWLPDCYQVNDDRRAISQRVPTRRECGLPDDAFVFCCFNNPYKITPEIFDVWMRLLTAIENSVLWLFEGNSAVARNLREEAEKRNISSQRLIFAGHANSEDHLARHRQADLFLDTLPYNAHTTASDALWAELPVLTCLGSTFAGRVAASLLKAVGLSELITTTLADYEASALKLARDPRLLTALKAKLADNRATHPLFDTKRFVRHMETAYLTMWEAYQHGRPPASFAVKAKH